MRKATLVLVTVVVLLFMAGCGSQSPSTAHEVSSTATAPVALTITDTPPDGVTVLFFQLTITGATLSPGDVPLLSSNRMIPVNVSQLQTESAFLGNASVAAGTYTGLSLTFANPQLTIYNASNSAISSTCAIGSVCQLTPTTTPLTLSFSSTPFPIDLSASSPLAFKLDIHLNTVIQSDLTVNLAATDGVTLSKLLPPSAGRPIPGIGKLRGTVQSVGTDQFTLQAFDGRNFTILVDSNTAYNFPTSVCSADAFSCLATGQVVKVTVSLQSDGSLLATKVKYVQLSTQQTVEGNIVNLATSGSNTIMDLILENDPSASMATTFPLGHHATVTVPSSGVSYAVDSGSFVIPSGLSFASASDLQVGQDVLVDVVQGSTTSSMATGTTANATHFGHGRITFTTDSIQLEPGQVTGMVQTITSDSLSFTLQTFANFFVDCLGKSGAAPGWAPIQITVQTTDATTFNGFTTNSFSGLATSNVVSVHGWLFSTPSGATTTTVAADSILLRPGPTPLF